MSSSERRKVAVEQVSRMDKPRQESTTDAIMTAERLLRTNRVQYESGPRPIMASTLGSPVANVSDLATSPSLPDAGRNVRPVRFQDSLNVLDRPANLGSSQPHVPSRFKYAALPDAGNHIRLVRFNKDGNASPEPTSLKVEVFSVAAVPRFQAISYMWGTEDNPRVIRVGGQRFMVRNNCGRVLDQLFFRRVMGWFWLDAICINQKDNAEKTKQVRMMHEIFEHAEATIVAIGDCGTSGYETFDVARGCQDRFAVPNGTSMPSDLRVRTISSMHELCSRLRHFADDAYWSRMWVVQEVALSGYRQVMCGFDMISLGKVVGLLQNMVEWAGKDGDRMEAVNPLIKSRMCDLLLPCLLDRDGLSWPWDLTLHWSDLHIIQLLDIFEHQGCSDPRDRIFGLLNVAKGPPKVTIDYNRTLLETALELLNEDWSAIFSDKQSHRRLINFISRDCLLILRVLGIFKWRFTVSGKCRKKTVRLESARFPATAAGRRRADFGEWYIDQRLLTPRKLEIGNDQVLTEHKIMKPLTPVSPSMEGTVSSRWTLGVPVLAAGAASCAPEWWLDLPSSAIFLPRPQSAGKRTYRFLANAPSIESLSDAHCVIPQKDVVTLLYWFAILEFDPQGSLLSPDITRDVQYRTRSYPNPITVDLTFLEGCELVSATSTRLSRKRFEELFAPYCNDWRSEEPAFSEGYCSDGSGPATEFQSRDDDDRGGGGAGGQEHERVIAERLRRLPI